MDTSATLEALLMAAASDDEQDYFDEYDIEEMEVARKTRKRAVRKTSGTKREKAVTKSTESTLLETWKIPLNEQRKFNVHVGSHDMKYKEQNWVIDERDISYMINPVNNKINARACAKIAMDNDGSLEDEEKRVVLEKAERGIDRWLDIVSTEEGVPKGAYRLAVVRLQDREDGSIGINVYYTKNGISSLKVKQDRTKSKVDEEVWKYIEDMQKWI